MELQKKQWKKKTIKCLLVQHLDWRFSLVEPNAVKCVQLGSDIFTLLFNSGQNNLKL